MFVVAPSWLMAQNEQFDTGFTNKQGRQHHYIHPKYHETVTNLSVMVFWFIIILHNLFYLIILRTFILCTEVVD